jgi:DNA-binding MurR/RpiR family transcriptional regulator
MEAACSPFLERIRARFASLSPALQRVARHVGDDPGTVAFGTVAGIAHASGSSEATVVRLARALDFPSFAAMQSSVRQMLAPGRTIGQYQTAADIPEGETDGLLSRIARADMENLRATVHRNTEKTLNEASTLLEQAREIFVTGSRSSYGIAHFFAFTLGNLTGNVTLLDPGGCHYHHDLSRLNQGTVLVAFAFPRYSRGTYELLTGAGSAGCRTVVITDSSLSPPGQLGDVVLEAVIHSRAATDSYTSVLSLATTLLTAVSVHHTDLVRANLTRLEEVYTRWHVYLDGETRVAERKLPEARATQAPKS